jgi:predicted nucleotide-binding protein
LKLTKTFSRTMFPARVIEAALDEFQKLYGPYNEKSLREASPEFREKHPWFVQPKPMMGSMKVSKGNESWSLDNVDEWYASYAREGTTGCYLRCSFDRYELVVELSGEDNGGFSISVAAPTNGELERVMRVFNLAENDARLPAAPVVQPVQPPVVVFIGHGGASNDWRLIKDHLHDLHHYKIEAYEVGARAGHTIRDVVSTMLDGSSFALLVMTGEDETANGGARARQNVVHETGLFQGRLGFNRAIAVVENGVEVFSNLDGVQQIRYDKGSVMSTFGEILATLRREFGDRR